jgi:DNA polymerase-3 subunit gamma/tau
MGQALYRKYRSKSLSEIIGQEHITDTLQEALKQGRISHAYLFTGPKGVGKTSIARILARAINDLPYTDDSPHLDIIEIDAASNRRIDEIRELRDKVYVAPTSATYKVYIIDEVHMLTREAFNALLKTLEEPPAHVVFILATTDAHKLPDTIISRTQRFSFRPVEKAKVVAHLQAIAKKEKIDVTPEALDLLAAHGEGSFRDSISLLDQARSSGQMLDAVAVRQLLGVPSVETIKSLTDAVINGATSQTIIRQLTDLYDQGYQAAMIAKQLGQAIREHLLSDPSTGQSALIDTLSRLLEVPAAHDPERYLEIVLLRSQTGKLDIAPAVQSEPEPAVSKPATVAERPTPPQPDTPKSAAPKPEAPKQPQPSGLALDMASWPSVLEALKQRYNTLYGVVRMAEPRFIDDQTVELAFAFAFHQKRINEKSNRQIISDIMHQLTGKSITLVCVLDKDATPPKIAVPAAKTKPQTDLKAISNIFGDAELLES